MSVFVFNDHLYALLHIPPPSISPFFAFLRHHKIPRNPSQFFDQWRNIPSTTAIIYPELGDNNQAKKHYQIMHLHFLFKQCISTFAFYIFSILYTSIYYYENSFPSLYIFKTLSLVLIISRFSFLCLLHNKF